MADRRNFEVHAFMFEPVAENYQSLNDASQNNNSGSDGDSNGSNETVDVGNGEWCSCGNCSVQNLTIEEYLCCKSWEIITNKIGQLSCICEHQEFLLLGLNQTVLTSVWPYIMAYCKKRGRIPNNLNNRFVTKCN
jgi:hypothetical protein